MKGLLLKDLYTLAKQMRLFMLLIALFVIALQQSLARLQVMAQALNDAVRPYALVMSWLTGRREWGTADR